MVRQEQHESEVAYSTDGQSSAKDIGNDYAPDLAHAAVMAILGWSEHLTYLKCQGATGTSLGTMEARGIRFEIRLSGWEDIMRSSTFVKPWSYISVRCGSGRWLSSTDLHYHETTQTFFDLDPFTKDERDGGLMERDKAYVVQTRAWEALEQRFKTLWALIKGESQGVVWFWCKAGRHRSYALVIMFLMWLTHVHEPIYFQKKISELRDRDLTNGRTCSLSKWNDLSPKERHNIGRYGVSFGDVLPGWAEFLNRTCYHHAWK